MRSERLYGWSVLNRETLMERISAEECRHDLTLEETQLLNAARERLFKWKAPTTRSRTMQEKKLEEQSDTTKEVVGTFVEDVTKAAKKQIAAVTEAANEAEAEEAPKKKSVTKAKTKKAAPAAKSAPKKKEATVAKKTKTAKAKSNGTAKAKAEGKRIPEDAVLKVTKSFKNPYKEGTGPFKRFEICMKANGKTYGALKAMANLKNTTPLNFVKAGGGEFISAGK